MQNEQKKKIRKEQSKAKKKSKEKQLKLSQWLRRHLYGWFLCSSLFLWNQA